MLFSQVYFRSLKLLDQQSSSQGNVPILAFYFLHFSLRFLQNEIPITIYIIMLSFYKESFLMTQLQLHHYKYCFFTLCLKYSFQMLYKSI